jgi:Ohr subfamily peroxiredoxin
MSEFYSTTATAWTGRRGRVATDDGRLDLALSVQSSLGGDDGPGTNPEQMFAAGYAACFHSVLQGMARAFKVDITDSVVTATVGLTGSMATTVDLTVHLAAGLPGLDEDVARKLLDAAHERCPYSRATRGNIPVEITLVPA